MRGPVFRAAFFDDEIFSEEGTLVDFIETDSRGAMWRAGELLVRRLRPANPYLRVQVWRVDTDGELAVEPELQAVFNSPMPRSSAAA